MDIDQNEADQSKKVVQFEDCQQTVHREDIQDINMDTDVPEDCASGSRNAAGSSLGTINQGTNTSFHDPGSRNAAGSSVRTINQGTNTSFHDPGSRNAAGSSVGTINQGASTSFHDPSAYVVKNRISPCQHEPACNSELRAQLENRGSDSSSSRRLVTSLIGWGNSSQGASSSRSMNCAIEIESVLTNLSTLFTRKLKKIPETFNYLIISETRIHPRNSHVVSEHGVTELVAFVRSYRSEDNVQNSEGQKLSKRHATEESQDSLIQDLVMDLWMLIEFSFLTLKEYMKVIDFKKLHDYITCFEIMKEERVLKQKRFYDLKERVIDISKLEVIKELMDLIDVGVGKIHYAIFIVKIQENVKEIRKNALNIRLLEHAAMNYKDWLRPKKSNQKRKRK